jgi:hypothetical protein
MRLSCNRTKALTAAVLTSALCALPANAQSIDSISRTEKIGSDGSIDMTVQYSFVLPLESHAPEKQMQAMDTGRSMLYEAAGKECARLLVTIAGSCKMLRFAVQSQVQKNVGAQPANAVLSGSATFRISLKTP